MRRFLALLALPLVVTACGGSSSTEVTCANTYWDCQIGTCLPKGWQVLDRKALDAKGVPKEAVVGFQSQEPVAGQFPTVTVTKEALSQKMTAELYSDASTKSVATLPGYEEGSVQTIPVDDASVAIHTFVAQPQPSEPKTRFFQVSFTTPSGTTGYSYTGAAPLAATTLLQNQIKFILSHATLKQAK